MDNKPIIDCKIIVKRFDLFYANEHKLSKYSKNNQKALKIQISKQDPTNKTKGTNNIFNEHFSIEEQKQQSGRPKPKSKLDQTKYSQNLSNTLAH